MTMRAQTSPADVYDIGTHGEDIAPFLYKLKADFPKHFDAVSRALRSIVPSVEGLTVELDDRRGHADLLVRQSGVELLLPRFVRRHSASTGPMCYFG